ncbi:phosphoribosylaminoimidazolesuccinocarboxamide synthase [Desulfovermiculus halophilus]|jgi:phosphoribosylaminoimidazole-succinocarboxamide synthase|uniref:phosphoribosylaminoimidazolesuccinocarboxamide synthase n=1 Tax=Desulfovermiculus halophilus TaxID=339722 RepID=UPI0004814C51|nr:phosphoribosylaminoimidazolesuccinocarboxamide synthase [Desulfovermiculus halophilus]
MPVVAETSIQEYPLVSKGKVRDIYAVDQETLLIVTTDRMSAFDVIMPDPIPYKGVVLNQLTCFWMQKFASLVPNHIKAAAVSDYPKDLQRYREQLEGRSVLAKRADPLPIECIVRGFLSGSGWKDYQRTGQVCGIDLPAGLQESSRLPRSLFTPSTKADIGEHDENISLEQARARMDPELVDRVQDLSIRIYEHGVQHAEERGLIIADTKFEFGLIDGSLVLIDEVLTPDSSRFWPQDQYQPGISQPSFDKQYLRDWLTENWDKTSPAPALPREVIAQTRDKYLQAYRLLTGQELNIDL